MLKQTEIYKRNLCLDCVQYERCKAVAGEEVETCYCVEYLGTGRDIN